MRRFLACKIFDNTWAKPIPIKQEHIRLKHINRHHPPNTRSRKSSTTSLQCVEVRLSKDRSPCNFQQTVCCPKNNNLIWLFISGIIHP
ncbi:hypothetical protein THIOM_004252 [Candidatus Thiomargarita nelsonii]|uniref:Uncharacterized protein n=1 Tax=Candidatus Thiomargarita nelsonii TaxID=1003181 RepID=A0A176RWD1_9GAMM|nr:hypothetical protein THIOM_004252 [Candidatus Thiomargarita nelsonii]